MAGLTEVGSGQGGLSRARAGFAVAVGRSGEPTFRLLVGVIGLAQVPSSPLQTVRGAAGETSSLLAEAQSLTRRLSGELTPAIASTTPAVYGMTDLGPKRLTQSSCAKIAE